MVCPNLLTDCVKLKNDIGIEKFTNNGYDIFQKVYILSERGINSPSTDVLIKLAEVFDVTLDQLAFVTMGQKDKLNIQDRELLIRFEQLHTMTEKQKELAKEILDLVILQHKFNELVGPSAAA